MVKADLMVRKTSYVGRLPQMLRPLVVAVIS